MIWHLHPFDTKKRIGYIHNQYVNLVPNDEDWIAIFDSDVLPLRADFGQHIEDIIKHNDNKYKLLGCMTNRISEAQCKNQLYNGKISSNYDILYHKSIADSLYFNKKLSIKEVNITAGFCMIFQKSTWREVRGFSEGLQFDINFSRKIKSNGGKIGICEGLYMFHSYRMGVTNPTRSISHLLP